MLINNGGEGMAARDLGFDFAAVPGLEHVKRGCTLYDVEAHRAIGPVAAAGYTVQHVPARGSVFLTLSACR